MAIYVEILVQAPLDRLWQHTQEPRLHQRWDLRFTRIEYLPRASEDEPQRFLYATRIGLGLDIAGEGESVATREGEHGERASSLRFRSDDPKSLIREGSGYWRYEPGPEGVRFLTRYDYRTRFGAIGRTLDRLAFRPLMGWATAWSFDRLRLWLEEDLEPALALRRWLARAAARLALAFVFLWHGLVPKLLFADPDERAMLTDAGVSASWAERLVTIAGVGEVLFGLALLVLWRRRWPAAVALVGMVLATVLVALYSPRYLTNAFNPVTLNLAVATLAAVDLLENRGLPSAARCRRKP